MTPQANAGAPPRQRRLPDVQPAMLQASVRKAETGAEAVSPSRRAMGQALDAVRHERGLLLKEFAAQLGRDERQVARWIAGTERVQADAIWDVPEFRWPWIVALARLSGYASVTTRIEAQP